MKNFTCHYCLEYHLVGAHVCFHLAMLSNKDPNGLLLQIVMASLLLCIISLIMTLNKSLDTVIRPLFSGGLQLCHTLLRGLVYHTTATNTSPTPSKHMITASVSNCNLITLKHSGWQQIARVSTMILTLPSISSLQWVQTDGPMTL